MSDQRARDANLCIGFWSLRWGAWYAVAELGAAESQIMKVWRGVVCVWMMSNRRSRSSCLDRGIEGDDVREKWMWPRGTVHRVPGVLSTGPGVLSPGY